VNPAARRQDQKFQGGDQVLVQPRSVQVYQHITTRS